ncbi:MAG: hypothetical protein U9N40_05055 [Euryarchaeota archaeon]|nr:hypothetical protein [Euryarchaeota archaeon]
MAKNERLTDAIKYEKIDVLKKDLFSYIDKHSNKINLNLPVFYGHIISTLDNAFPNLDDNIYDEFMDSLTFRILNAPDTKIDLDYVTRLINNAARSKRKSSNNVTLRILSAIKLMENKDYLNAIEYLSDNWKYDARVGYYIAYCYLMLSETEKQNVGSDGKIRPSRYELDAREQLLELVRVRPPIYRFKFLDNNETPLMESVFWIMITKSLEWFPSERWFLRTGIKKAKKDGNISKRKELLKIAVERFYNDLDFLRESYNQAVEQRDGMGASGVVKQMMQQYPNNLEPIYYGIKLSLLSNSIESYFTFRDLAKEKEMPQYLIQLLDYAYYTIHDNKNEAEITLRDLKKRYKSLYFYMITLEYLANDVFTGDEKKAKYAKMIFFDSLNEYVLHVIKVHEI